MVHEGDYRSIPKTESIFDVNLARALELFAQPKKGRGRAAPLKEFTDHGLGDEPIKLLNGPYGLYVKLGKVNASLPEDATAETATKEMAIAALQEKMPTAGVKASKKAKATKTSAPKASKTEAKTEVKTAVKTTGKTAEKTTEKIEKKKLPSRTVKIPAGY